MATRVLQKNPIYPFYFLNKMKNKLILITVVRKILSTFDMKDCLYTFIATKESINNKLLEVKGACAPMPHSWRRQWAHCRGWQDQTFGFTTSRNT